MAQPSDKSPELAKLLDDISTLVYGRVRTASIGGDVCVTCGQPAVTFTDEISRREYRISGMCQTCQDKVF